MYEEVNGIKLTKHFMERFVERNSMAGEGNLGAIIKAFLNTADCLFEYKRGSNALRTEFGIIVLIGKTVAVTFLEWSFLNKAERKKIRALPKNFIGMAS
jgi:hypothetical protein